MCGGRKILMVEDDENNRMFFSIAVKRLGSAHVQTVPDGGRAIEYLDGKGGYADRSKFPLPDVIVLDLRMPNVNGFQILTWQSGSPFSSIPVIVLEGAGSTEEHKRARTMGAILTFTKPCELKRLFAIVKKIVNLDLTQSDPVS
jgi:CheY-like chemotaxis protein